MPRRSAAQQAIARAREGTKTIDSAKPTTALPAPYKSGSDMGQEVSAARSSAAEAELSLRKQDSRKTTARDTPLPRPAPLKERLQGGNYFHLQE